MKLWAFVIGVDQQIDAHIPCFPYVEPSLAFLQSSLLAAGVPSDQLSVVSGPFTTLSIIRSRLWRFLANLPPDANLLVYIASRVVPTSQGDATACWDTLSDDVAATSFPDHELLALIGNVRVTRCIALMDRSPWSTVPTEQIMGLGDLATVYEHIVGIESCSPSEVAHAASTLKCLLVTRLIGDAVAGRAMKALLPTGLLTTRSLFHYIQDELPRLLRKHVDTEAEQTPILFGLGTDDPWLDLSAKLGGDAGQFLNDPAQLARVYFRSTDTMRVKDLTEWRKTFQMPESASPSSRKFVARIAAVDVKADAEALVAAARTTFDYKRRDVDFECELDGTATVRTPDFTYIVSAALDANDVSQVIFTKELSRLASLDFLRGDGFRVLFQDKFDQLSFSFEKPIDVEALIDRFEEQPPAGVKLHVTDGQHCELTMPGKPGILRIERKAISVQGRGGLLDLFFMFLAKVGPLDDETGIKPMLPAKR